MSAKISNNSYLNKLFAQKSEKVDKLLITQDGKSATWGLAPE